ALGGGDALPSGPAPPRDRGGDRLLGGRRAPLAARGLEEAERGDARMIDSRHEDTSTVEAALRRATGADRPGAGPGSAAGEREEYFEGRRRGFEVALDWTLVAPFARRVLRATSRIPYGGVLSYAEVAADAGSPRGFRAAGNALGANPIPIVVPCHRVLRSGGALGGYGGGLERKRFLLQ